MNSYNTWVNDGKLIITKNVLLFSVSAIGGESCVDTSPVKQDGRHNEEDDVTQNQNGYRSIQIGQ